MILIDKQSRIPYYYQLAEIVRQWIREELPKSDLVSIPSEPELAKMHSISRATVRQALDLLEREGLIYKAKGKGTFAAKARAKYNLTTLIPTTDDILRRGWTPTVKVISAQVVDAVGQVGTSLELSSTEQVFELCRLRLGNDQPISIQWSYIPVHLCPDLLDQELAGSLSHLLEERYNIRFSTAHEVLRARLVTSFESKLLAVVSTSPVIYMERITYDQDRRPAEFLESVWRSDLYDFEFNLSRAST